MFILALNSADQLVLLHRSGPVTLPLTAEEEGWGGRGNVCVCLSWEERWSCGGRAFLNVRNEPRVSLQYNFLVTLIIWVCNFQRWEDIHFLFKLYHLPDSFSPLPPPNYSNPAAL